MLPMGSKFFPFRVDSFSERRQKVERLASPESVIYFLRHELITLQIQQNFNHSNNDGSFTMGDLNSFLSPYKILLIIFRDTLGKVSYFIMKLYVVCTN